MKSPVFSGTCTALITPFRSSGAIDYTAFATQIDRQLEAGIDALCVCGTTGESEALSAEEHVKLVDYCVAHVAGQCKILADSGSNDTSAALYLCQHAEESGADALLFAYYQFCSVVSGAVVKNLNSDKVAEALFPLPPLSEQHRIVNQLEILLPYVKEL